MAKQANNKSHPDLLGEIEKLKARIEQIKTSKKYGLVWEDKSEDVVEQCKNEIPVLKEIKSRSVKNDDGEPTHLMIEGDNYHALQVLNYTHKGKVDVIYIDPPYNTGAKDWKYNNDYVDSEDTYRHSKWISMMYHRLINSRDLLSADGVLILTIDHNEQENIGILLRELFPEKEITCVTIVHNPAGIQGNNFSYSHEYAYFVYPKGGRYIGQETRAKEDSDVRNFRDVTGDDSLRKAGKNCFYAILVKNSKIIGFGDVVNENIHPESINVTRDDGVLEIYPIDPQGIERKWRFARNTVEKIKDDLIVHEISSRGIFDIKRVKNNFNFKTVWTNSKYSANNHGTQLLNKIIEHGAFSYPKSLHAVIDCLVAGLNNKKEAIILDYFAGSGTTAHAVIELNKEDGGKRQSISVTNNEGGIAKEICHPRIKKVINGYSYQGKEEELIWQKKIGIRELKKGSDIYKKSEEIKEKTLEECDGCEVKRTMAKKDGILQLIKEKTIDGKKDGLGGSLKYYKTDFIKKKAEGKISDEDKIALSQQAGEMIAIRENTLEKEKETDWWQIFSADNQSTAIYFREDKSKLNDLVTEISQKDTPSALYVFSWGTNEYSNEFADYENIRIEDIPQPILEVYRKINQL